MQFQKHKNWEIIMGVKLDLFLGGLGIAIAVACVSTLAPSYVEYYVNPSVFVGGGEPEGGEKRLNCPENTVSCLDTECKPTTNPPGFKCSGTAFRNAQPDYPVGIEGEGNLIVGGAHDFFCGTIDFCTGNCTACPSCGKRYCSGATSAAFTQPGHFLAETLEY